MPFNEPVTGPTTSILRVAPEQVLSLKAKLQPIHDEVAEFLQVRAQAMMMEPLGADPVSIDTAQAFNENAQAAIDAAQGFLTQLEGVLSALDQAAKTYNLVEDTNAQAFRQVTQ